MSNCSYTIELRNTFKQFIRYGLVGFTTNLFGYAFFLLITHIGIEPKLAMTLLYFLSTTFSFFGNWKWVFANNQHFIAASSRFFIAHLLGYLINLMLLATLTDRLDYPYQLVQVVAIIVVAGFLFLAFKFFVFPTKQSEPT
jgi:putative flippase GtrA